MFRTGKFSTSIPAHLSNFAEQGQLTKATLKVFHVGSTSDGRKFSETFGEKLKRTIGGTPIVARYDLDKEDFDGHANTQNVFGFVPEEPQVKFEKDEDGNTWLVTDVRLFTKRGDVGKIAKLIPGKSQSLELDPKTVKYNIIADDFGDIQSIELTDGDLIGLSVLGDHQTPAYTGSAFFSSLLNKGPVTLEQVIEKYLSIESFIEIDKGGESVHKTQIFETDEARSKRLEKESSDLRAAIGEIEEEIPSEEEEEKEEIQLTPIEDNVTPVEPEPEVEVDTSEEDDQPAPVEDTEIPVEPDPDPVDPEATPEGAEDGGDEGSESFEEQEGGDGNESNKEDPIKVDAESKQTESDQAALTSAEREELNGYRRQSKIEVIESYSEFLPEEILNEFKEDVDKHNIEDLEGKLALSSMAIMRKAKQQEKETPEVNASYTMIPLRGAKNTQTGDALSEYIGANIEVKK